MKRCDYCGKEISYSQQYCDGTCESGALRYYKTVKSKQKLFSIINIIVFLTILIGAFTAMLYHRKVGAGIVWGGVVILGILYYLLPFGTPEQIKKHKIKKMVKNNKTIGIIAFAVGVILLLCSAFVF